MPENLKDLLAKDYREVIAVELDGRGKEHFAAWLLDMPGCIAQGESREGAVQRLREIKPAYFKKMLELDVPIPQPTAFPPILSGVVGFYDARTGAVGFDPASLRSQLANVA